MSSASPSGDSEHSTDQGCAATRWCLGAQPASMKRRLAGRALDIAFVTVLSLAAVFVTGVVVVVLEEFGAIPAGTVDRLDRGEAWPMEGLAILGLFAANLASEILGGTSPGKLALGLRVISDRAGRPTLRGILLRNLLLAVDTAFFCAPAWESMRRTPLVQRLGDRAGHTVVVTSRSAPEPSLLSAPRVVLGIGAAALVAVGSGFLQALAALFI